jgi:type I restriction enzyme S subunit
VVSRVSIAHLTKEKLIDVSFIVPPSDEQKDIVDFIEKETAHIDSIISKSEKEIELLQEYRTALISEVVTGKIDVREERI